MDVPNVCIRCHKDVGNSLHIFQGGESRRELLEITMKRSVSLCDVLVPDVDPDTFYFDKDGTFIQFRTAKSNKEIEDDARELLQQLKQN
uniref:Uncharacterized protein n=1 Tax=viral metagenome TaxID=1070528 RepID=A0A6C0JTE1_9ZZZZ